MCGVAGFYGIHSREVATRMIRTLAHRGPDDEGIWTSDRFPVSVANRRLKIIDLTTAGHQPMISEDRRYTLTFNGEIYNYLTLRSALVAKGHRFKSQTDTEVLLQALIEWGPKALERLNGMFSFGLWDDLEGRLLIARDRLGIKPLYYFQNGTTFSFASEIKALLASRAITAVLDQEALKSYLRLLWVPEPKTLFKNVFKVEPGTYLVWQREQVETIRYWDVPRPEPSEWEGKEREASEELKSRLQSAVTRQLRSDVPIGVFLSGGIDSTAIVSMASAGRKQVLNSYCIGFGRRDRIEDGAVDELGYARMASVHAGTVHKELILSADVVSLLPTMVRHLEDPVADPAAINCFLICQAARETSTVLLSGSGADELFGGYRKYLSTLLATKYQRLPSFLRQRIVEPIAKRLPVVAGRTGLRLVRFGKRFLRHASEQPLSRFLGYSTYYDSYELAALLGSSEQEAEEEFVGLRPLVEAWERRATDDLVDRMTYVDLKFYLPGLGLAYMDKASMAASVEVRVPLLDDDVVEFAARLPGNQKARGMRTKLIFRDAVEDLVPQEIHRRGKAPFAAPTRTWLRRDLDEMVRDCLGRGGLLDRGLVSPAVVEGLLADHRQGGDDHSLRIWALLTLELWFREFVDDASKDFQDEAVAVTSPTGAEIT